MSDLQTNSILRKQLAELRAIERRLVALEGERLLILQGLDAINTALRMALSRLPPAIPSHPVAHAPQPDGPPRPFHQDSIR